MAGLPNQGTPDNQTSTRAASGRPAGAGETRYGTAALQLLDNGYLPLPLPPASKRCVVNAWTTCQIDLETVSGWTAKFPSHGIGLRCGSLVAIDIDVLDADLSHQLYELAVERLGPTLMRVGHWPKRLLLYRTEQPFAKIVVGAEGRKLEVLARGQQFVAFGRHPDTGRDYGWPLGETPLEVAFDSLPTTDETSCRALCNEAGSLLGVGKAIGGSRRRSESGGGGGEVVRDLEGRVVDGRDSWLSRIAFHTVHDAVAGGGSLDPEQLTQIAWERFTDSSDLSRPHGSVDYTPRDAARKVADKLRLLSEGRLPARDAEPAEAAPGAPSHAAEDARATLDAALADACRTIEAWHLDPASGDAPQIGIRATVGLGKSQLARDHVLELRQRLRAAGLPSGILVLTPSHVLAEETAAGWREGGIAVAVLRGYEARDPITRRPMCADIDAVHAAITAGSDIHGTACIRGAHRCAFFEGCPKQRNRLEVQAAEVVVAPYDALFSGLAFDAARIGVILVDEGCWRRAEVRLTCDWSQDPPSARLSRSRRSYERATSDAADLLDLSAKVTRAVGACGLGLLTARALRACGLDEADCRLASALEKKAICNPGLFPGMPADQRRSALAIAMRNEAIRWRVAVWEAFAEQLRTGREGRLRVLPGERLQVLGVKPIHITLQAIPVLHLDATLRPELARTVLPRLRVEKIEAAAPFMEVTLVAGSFGKSSLCPNPAVKPEEQRRRQNRLAECVDYVRWQARIVAPRRLLVVTYQSIEAAFADIPDVEVAHFNAIAGLDRYRDVAALVVVGRPLPQDRDLVPLAGAFFGSAITGGYTTRPAAVRMRDGTSRAVRVTAHEDPQGELLRAAICDDELIQAIGRGRGINRTAADPLAVHILADVALPLVHDRVLPWELVKPDLLQRMLLVGVAVDSPGDACRLHPNLLPNPEQAKKAFQRLFGGQIPIRNIHREMSPKSAAYRRAGRGRSWQRAWWIDGDPEAVRSKLEAVLGTLAGWEPCD